MKDFAETAWIVTGAGSGIGRSLARWLLAHGARVTLAGRREAKLREAAEGHADALCVPTDVAVVSDLQALVDTTVQKWGRLDGVINNAGFFFGGQLDDVSTEEIAYSYQVNLVAPAVLTRLALPHLMRSDRAAIITISSLGALVPLPFQQLYCSAKAGQRAFGQSLRRELAGTQVEVFNVYPGFIETEMVQGEVLRLAGALGKSKKSLIHPDRVAQQVFAGVARRKYENIIAAADDRVLPIVDRWLPWLVEGKLRSMRDGFLAMMREGTRLARLRHRPSPAPAANADPATDVLPLPSMSPRAQPASRAD